MFGIGWTEFVVIAFVLLIVVGPKHLPGVLKKTGMIINELKNASRELREQVSEEVRDLEKAVGPVPSPKSYIEDLGKEFTEAVDSPYAELLDTESSVKEEISSIKDNLKIKKKTEKTASVPKKENVPADPDEPPDSADKTASSPTRDEA